MIGVFPSDSGRHGAGLTVDIEHLWRELSHAYTANPARNARLPQLAARHMMDGFPVELMDGDAGGINMQWVQAVMSELQKQLPLVAGHPARLFSLSILGEQSCGKSTLLNIAFGVRFNTSVGRCTRGVNMQLLKTEGHRDYDYLLLFDTEGVRAPEFNHLDPIERTSHDNRLATIALLPADAAILLIPGENAEAIQQMLPIVLTVYRSSAMAEGRNGRLNARLFIVYNRINLQQENKMKDITERLENYFAEAIRQVDRIFDRKGKESAEEVALNGVVSAGSSLGFDPRDDLRIFGSFEPDTFIPLQSTTNRWYGRDVAALIDHIRERCTRMHSGWHPKTPDQLSEKIKLVWDSVMSANFELSFQSTIARLDFDAMEQDVARAQAEVSKAYNQAYDQFEEAIQKDAASPDEREKVNKNESAFQSKEDAYWSLIHVGAASVLNDQSGVILTLLERPCNQLWRQQTESKWEIFQSKQEHFWRRLVKIKMESCFRLDAFLQEYRIMFSDRIRHELDKRSNKDKIDEGEMDALFHKLFQDVASRALLDHPSIAHQVESKVNQVFERDSDIWSKMQNHYVDSKTTSWWKSVKKRFHSATERLTAFIQGKDLNQEQPLLYQRAADFVAKELDRHKRYSDDAVTEVMKATQKLLTSKRQSGPLVGSLYQFVRDLLVDGLKEKQSQWDAANSLSAKFMAGRDDAKILFDGMVKGVAAAELLMERIRKVIETKLTEAASQYAVKRYCTKIRDCKLQWLIDADTMQAHLDKDLLAIAERSVPELISTLNQPGAQYDRVLRDLILASIDRDYKSDFDSACASVTNALRLSAAEAKSILPDSKGVAAGRTQKYLNTLKEHLAYLEVLSTALPPYDAATMESIDHDGPDVFDKLIETIKKSSEWDWSQAQDDSRWSPTEMSASVLSLLRDRAGGDSSTSMVPRCGAPCPRCQSTCTRPSLHTTDASDIKKLHSCTHQPLGLAGVGYHKTDELVGYSCAQSVEHSNRFRDPRVKEEAWVNYSDFCKVFPDWSLPV